MKLKAIAISLIIIIVAFIGYYQMNKQADISIEELNKVLLHDTSGAENLKILIIEKFKDERLVVYSYDLGDGHYITCRNLKNNYLLSGGSGPVKVDERQPLSVTTFGSATENYLVSYGEILNDNISSMIIDYGDGEKKQVEIRNKSFLVIENKPFNVLVKITAYDNNGNIVYHLP